jgi:hypothetical protein
VDAKNLGASDEEAKKVADSVVGTTGGGTKLDDTVATLIQNNAPIDRSKDVLVAGPMDAAVSRIDSTNTSQKNFEDTEFGDLEAAQKYAESKPVKAPTFADAYDAARSLYGSGQVFTWNGKQYSTDSKEENPSLAAASDALKLKTAADKTVATLSDPTIRDAVQPKTVTTAAKDYADASYWNDDVVGDPSTGVAIKGGEMNRPDTLLGKAVTKFETATGKVVQTGLSNLAQAFGEQGESFGGALAAIKVASPNNVLVQAGKAAKDFGKEIETPESKQQLQNIINDVSKADGVGNKLLTAVTSAWNNPTGAVNAIVQEGLQEVLPIGVALKASKIIGLGAAAGLDTALNASESMGGAYNQTYSESIKKGMSKEDADALATQVAVSAGGITIVTSGLVDAAVVKSIMREGAGTVGSQIAKGATKEGFAENIEETTTALATQYLTTGKINLNDALTQGAVGHLFGKTTAGSVGTIDAAANADQGVSSTASNVVDQTGLGSIGKTVPADDLTNINFESDIQTQVASDLNAGQDVQTVIQSTIQSASDSGQNVSAAANDSIIASINNGVDLESVVDAVNNSNTNVNASANTDGGVTTITTADNNNNTQSTTTIDPNTNITATTTTDPNTNITTNNTTDNNNTVNINQNINSNNNTTTNTVTDLDTNKKVTIVTNKCRPPIFNGFIFAKTIDNIFCNRTIVYNVKVIGT